MATVKPYEPEATIKVGQSARQTPNRAWWGMKPDDAAKAVTATLLTWFTHQRWRTNDYAYFARMYSNLPALSGGSNASLGARRNGVRSQRLNFNAVQSALDTFKSKMVKNPVRPEFVANDGDYSTMHQAQQLTTFTDGIFYETKFPKKARVAVRDSGMWGDGLIHWYHENGKVKCRRVVPVEFWVDETECELAEPTQAFIAMQCDRAKAAALYPDHADYILNEAKRVDLRGGPVDSHADLITIVHGWHLPSGPDADDGKVIVCVDEKCLNANEGELRAWEHDRFPVERLPFCERPVGYFAQGGIEQCAGQQRYLNRLFAMVEESHRLGGTFRWWCKTGANIVLDHITNEIGAILRSDDKPEDLLPGLVQPEIYQQIIVTIQRIYDQWGVSAMDAKAEKPKGELSGEALRLLSEVGTERLMDFGRAYEEFHLANAELAIMTLQDCLKENGKSSYSVSVPNGQSLTIIDWKEIKLKDIDGFRVQCFSTSSLPQDVSGRIQTIQDLIQAGMLDQDTGFDLLNFPDLKRVQTLRTSQRKWVVKRLDAIVNEGIYHGPVENRDNYGLCATIGLDYYARGQVQSLGEDRLMLLARWIDASATLLKASQPPAPQGPPPAVPEAPPVSPLLPTGPEAAAPQ